MKTVTVEIGDNTTRVRIPTDIDAINSHPLANDYLHETAPAWKVDQTRHALAIAVAVKKIFGTTSFWWPDSGLRGYGQVCKPIPSNPGCNNCITGRISVSTSI